MAMKNALLIIFYFFITTSLFAQPQGTSLEYIYLLDGSYIKGKVVERNQDNFSIQLYNQKIISLPADMIREIIPSKEKVIVHPDGIMVVTEGLRTSFKMLSMVGKDFLNEEQNMWGIGGQLLVGHRFVPWLQISGGIELAEMREFFATPLLDLKGLIGTKATAPYYNLSLGYGFPILQSGNEFTVTKGGWMVHPAVGYSFANRHGGAFYFDAGYRMQKMTYFTDFNGSITDRITFNRLVFRMGWEF